MEVNEDVTRESEGERVNWGEWEADVEEKTGIHRGRRGGRKARGSNGTAVVNFGVGVHGLVKVKCLATAAAH